MAQLRGWKVGTIRGVPVYLHISLLFLVFYVFLIATAQFASVAKMSGADLSALHGNPSSWGLIFVFALVVSVFLHELGHVVVAQALGTKVQSITLLMLGGISQMERMPEKRYAEFKVSVVGPLVSFAIAGGLMFLARITSSADIDLFSYWLSRVNFTLGVFNLLPAFPTDGGRVLRSILAARQGKLRSTQNAVKVSKVFAWAFGIVGFMQFNIVLIFVAIFIYAGASSELATLTGQMLLHGVRAGDLGKRLDVMREDLSLDRVAEHMIQSRSLVLPVRTADGGVALVNSGQLKRISKSRWPETPVKRIMTVFSNGVDVNELIEKVMESVPLAVAGGVPLLDQGRLVGVLRSSDVSEAIELRSLGMSEETQDRMAA